MGHRKKDKGLEAFNSAAVRSGISYAEAQKQETQEQTGRIRVPKTETKEGTPAYMTVAARNRMKRMEAEGCQSGSNCCS